MASEEPVMAEQVAIATEAKPLEARGFGEGMKGYDKDKWGECIPPPALCWYAGLGC